MDNISESDSLIVIAATNRPEMLDAALLRPGRFDRHVHVPKPNAEDIVEIFKIICKYSKFENELTGSEFSSMFSGFSGAEIVSACQKAAFLELESENNLVYFYLSLDYQENIN